VRDTDTDTPTDDATPDVDDATQGGQLRKDEIRAYFEPTRYELRAETEPSGEQRVTMQGYMVPFNEWTEIDSVFEGRFLERVAPSAFRKATAERMPKVLFQHGHDPHIGDKPIGVPQVLEPRERGQWFEVDLFASTSYVRDLIPALEAGQFGTSFRFRPIKEEFVTEPERSDHNPEGLPERTILEATLPEFGPVTFPAYDGATAAIRSAVLTEEHFISAERRATLPVEEPEPNTSTEPAPATRGKPNRRRDDYLGAPSRPDWELFTDTD